MITLKTGKSRQTFKLKTFTAAVRKGTAAFFYSTIIPSLTKEITKKLNIITKGTAKIQRLRFFIVAKGRYMTYYRSRAPPLQI